MANFTTENELEDILHQMGHHIHDKNQFATFKNEIDNLLDRELCLSDADEDVMNESLFASLSVDPAAQFIRQERNFPTENLNIQSPIVSRKRQGKRFIYENVELQSDFDDESSNEYPERNLLVDRAWRSIHRAMETCNGATETLKSISLDGSDIQERSSVDDEENIAESVSVGLSTETEQSELQKSSRPEKEVWTRNVLSLEPGRAPKKYDPVTRYHFYKSEWDRHPAPGEMRRLSLRWKVREFMLRHDVPRLNENNEDWKANHDKDWSPRPYID
ncbi:Centriolar and ciliogenesis-associated protein hyls-1 [Caenorhabditis elegans]|uniref:Centriolar and ciliogenesis-associated protein hyls-1 n=1 Tax=Caenorhabditis elegans TaxID=6239 RepID=HYLS1_CAEEL|nr:Centriolar and ciliogenesis-associated protein hyls-1 [Caenorhabditis elegans]Q95X94.1 RecName: Full=Centriolar and ciliogenesis-associated protein hyls-1; AltName: Full=Hydrolethalus syndrome protein 1 homolog [Caenorhabditis elegans]CCD63094.1 Centriolar and ciliogenesis-associated protein hyls-1 [Caenorhabditis elegans]|eukprot:NP_504840.1 Hydrolethalus syndrome protein 1 homolog [Caenorhabditis elegans]